MNTIKMVELVTRMTEMYGENNKKIRDMQIELSDINEKIYISLEEEHGKVITVGEYKSLLHKQADLREEINNRIHYCKGIYDVREFLMDIWLERDGADEVELDFNGEIK